jgi:hypothetical protein
MIKETAVQPQKRQITDLTQSELDMIYSLTRIGDWHPAEIGQKYKLSEADVGKVFSDYVELRKMLTQQPHPPQDMQQESVEEPKRKKRSDAKFETSAEKQKAYRLRLKERQRVGTELSPTAVTDSPPPAG